MIRMSICVLFVNQKTAYEMRISDWSSDVCSSDLDALPQPAADRHAHSGPRHPVHQHPGIQAEEIPDVTTTCAQLVDGHRPALVAEVMHAWPRHPARADERRVG